MKPMEMIAMGVKPADGSTVGQPFPSGMGGSHSFRIPAMVTLSDGTLVAAADARWNTCYDGGGLDTVVSRSSDNGETWNYTFANFLGDHGNAYSGKATCFIDPALAATADDTIFMICDLYPGGVALNGEKEVWPCRKVGFNAEGKLLLTDDGYDNPDAVYDYYLDGAVICDSAGNQIKGYTVDPHFNLYENGQMISNLFFSNSPFAVVRTGYLYLTKSTDKGATWSAPVLLDVKTEEELVCLVGPAGGRVTSKGVIVFPIYSFSESAGEHTGLLYSVDKGVTWRRSAALNEIHSSEAAVIELPNGKLRVFFRNRKSQLHYVDFDMDNNCWSASVPTGVAVNSNTQLSALAYSKKAPGNKQMVLISCPAGPGAAGSDSSSGACRCAGRIFGGLLENDGDYSMTWLPGTVEVTATPAEPMSGDVYTPAQGYFSYSSLAELKDNGTVALLYEDSQHGWATGEGFGYTITFATYTKKELETAFGFTFE